MDQREEEKREEVSNCKSGKEVQGLRLAMSTPQTLSTLTTLGVIAAVNGTRMKIRLLWIAYAKASWVHMPD